MLKTSRELWAIGEAITNKVATLTLVSKGKLYLLIIGDY